MSDHMQPCTKCGVIQMQHDNNPKACEYFRTMVAPREFILKEIERIDLVEGGIQITLLGHWRDDPDTPATYVTEPRTIEGPSDLSRRLAKASGCPLPLDLAEMEVDPCPPTPTPPK